MNQRLRRSPPDVVYTPIDVTSTSAKLSVTPLGTADNDNLLEPGEMYELSLLAMETNLSTSQLIKSETFIMEVMTSAGAVLHIERTTPVALDKYNDLG